MRYWEWSSPFDIKPEETALIVIDMQKGFVEPDGALFTAQAREQLDKIADFKRFCNRRNIPVFMSVFAQGPDFHNDYYWFRNKERGLLNPDGSCKFQLNTPDTEMPEELKPIGDDVVFPKYTYSCFAHTELETWLKKKRIRTVIICGTCTNWCVDSTIRDAYHRDFNVVVLSDCVSTYPHACADADQWNTMLLDLWGEAFAKVLSADDARKEIEKESAFV